MTTMQFFQVGNSVLNLPVSTAQSRRHQCFKILRYPVSGFCNPAFIKGPDGVIDIQYAPIAVRHHN